MAALVASITKPFGINVYPDDGLDLGPAFPRFRVQAGETAWAAIERATRARALLAVATADGHLALTRAKTQPGNDSPPAIILGGKKATPVKATGTFEAHERYRNYRILAQRAGEAGSAEDRAHVVATAEDTEVKRYRPLTIVAGDQLDGAAALTQVRWEANVRRGRARRASYTIAGATTAAGCGGRTPSSRSRTTGCASTTSSCWSQCG